MKSLWESAKAPLAIALLVLMVLALVVGPNPHTPAAVHAQNAGTVGIQTVAVAVFKNQNASGSSAILPDNGFAANYLSFCNTGFAGSINLEYLPQSTHNTGIYVTLARATFVNPDSGCHHIQIGGYYPNLRSTVVQTSGSVNADYTASSAPIPFFNSAIGSNGATSPVQCDQDTVIIENSGLGFGGIFGPQNAGDTVVVCSLTISINGTPGVGTISLAFASSGACSAPNTIWQIQTTTATPQILYFPNLNLRQSQAFPLANQELCFQQSTGVTVNANFTYASVSGL